MKSFFSDFKKIYFYFLICLYQCFFAASLLAVPAVSQINPLFGPATGNQAVTITGSGFTDATQVFFGSIAADSFVINSDTQITATSPTKTYLGNPVVQGTPGTVDITVISPEGTSAYNQNDRYVFQGSYTAFLPDFGTGTVYTTDTSTNLLDPTTIAVQNNPNDVAISYDGKTSYCVNSGSNSISIIDVGAKAVIGGIGVGQSFPILMAVGYDPVDNIEIGYTTNLNSNTVTQIDLTPGATAPILANVAVGVQPTGGIITNLNAGKDAVAYVTNLGSGTISRIDFSPTTATPPAVPIVTNINTNVAGVTGSAPAFITLAPDASTAYFADVNVNQYSVKQLLNVDTANPTVGQVITDPSLQFGFATLFPQIAISAPQGNPPKVYAYVTNTGNFDSTESITIIDISDKNNPFVTCTLAGGFGPNGDAVTPDGTKLYACNASNNTGASNVITITNGLPTSPPNCTVTTVSQVVGTSPTDPTITPDQSPLAFFTAIPSTVVSGSPVNFNASASISPVGTNSTQPNGISNYSWDFGDGSPIVNTTSPTITHNYTDPGAAPINYQATLTVTNLAGTSTSDTDYFNGQFVLRNGQTINSGFSAIYTQVITVQTTGNTSTTQINSSENPSNYGDPVTFTATVTGNAGTPSGTVNFFEDGMVFLGTGTLDGTGTTSITTTALGLTSGDHTISAEYQGSVIYNMSSASLMQIVNPAPTITTISSPTPDPTIYGQPVTFNATVSTNVGTLNGSVNFIDETDPSNPVIIATSALDPTTNTATGTYAFLNAGTNSVVAMYVPSPTLDPNHTTSTSSPLSRDVIAASTTLSLVTSQTPITYGQSVTFTATINFVPPGTGTLFGEIDFYIDGNIVGIEPINGNNSASLTVGPPNSAYLLGGTHSIQAIFVSYSTNIDGSQATISQVVNLANPGIAVVSTPNPSTYGQQVTIKATVSGVTGGVVPTGTIIFTSSDGTNLGNAVTLSNGVATITTSLLSVGTDNILASYSGDGNYNPINGNTTQIVNAVTPVVTVVDNPNPSTYGQQVTITATVATAGGGAIPTGSITFTSSDGTNLGNAVMLANGMATITTSLLSVGSDVITANYMSNTTDYNNATGNTTQAVTAVTPLVTVVDNPNPSTYGQQVTITANVVPVGGGITPTGSITFTSSDSTNLGNAVMLANGTATITTSLLSAGNDVITANYMSNTTDYNNATGNTTQTVTAVTPLVTVIDNPNPSTYGQQVTITATVATAGGGATPTGSITFTSSDGTNLGNAVMLANGMATITTSLLSVGSDVITANYMSNTTDYNNATGNTTQVVTAVTPLVTVVDNPNPSTYGQQVTITATVATAGGGATPTGSITFTSSDGTNLGNAVMLANGMATITTSLLSVGSDVITANYMSNTTDYNNSMGNTTQTVTAVTPVVTVVDNPNPSTYGQQVTITATVATAGSGATPTGSITFTSSDGTNLGNAVMLANGMATITTSLLSAGSDVITANYTSNTTDYNNATGNTTQVVTAPTPIVTVVDNPNPSTYGQQVTITATVAPVGSGAIPTGTVTFTSSDGTNLGNAVILANGMATINTSLLSAGSDVITANYTSNTTNYNNSTGNTTQTVTAVTPVVTVVDNPNPSTYGQQVTITATVAPVGGGATPTGSITFTSSDGTNLGNAVILANGTATITTSLLSVGINVITANYTSNTTDYNNATRNTTQTVTAVTPLVTVVDNPNPSTYGQQVTITATVATAGGGAIPTGSITFTSSDGTNLGNAVMLANGTATITTSLLSVGSDVITANYTSNTTNYNNATGNTTQAVTAVTPMITLSNSPNPSTYGSQVTLTATLFATGGGATPTGTVTFTSSDGTPLGTVNLVNGVATFNTSNLQVGTPLITATYNSNTTNYNNTSITDTQTVNKISTTTALTSSLNPALEGSTVVFTATVTPSSSASGPATGNVVFSIDGGPGITVALTNGQASLPVSDLTLGTHTVTANYLGTPIFGSSSNSIQEVIYEYSTTTVIQSSMNPVFAGQNVTFTITVNSSEPTSIPTGFVTLSIDGVLGSPLPLVNGQATYSTSTLSVGNHTLIAYYSGDVAHLASVSAPFVETVFSILPPRGVEVFQVRNRFATQTEYVNVLIWKAPKTDTPPVAYEIYRDADLTHLVATIDADYHFSSSSDFSSSAFPSSHVPSDFSSSDFSSFSSSHHEKFRYEDHDRKKNHTYQYFIVSVNEAGFRSDPVKVVLHK